MNLWTKISLLLIIFFAFSCGLKKREEGFKKVDKNYSYRLLTLGEGVDMKNGEVIFTEMMVKNIKGDTLLYSPDYIYTFKSGKHTIDSIIQLFRAGDQFLLKLPKESFLSFLKLKNIKEDESDTLMVHFSLKNSLPAKEAENELMRNFSEREVREKAELSKFLKQNKGFEFEQGIYYKVLESGQGDRVNSGSEVSLQYKGMFLDGYVFDNTIEKGITPTFRFGQNYQLVEGLRLALNNRREGERIKIILPSQLAFGATGSIAGIVPPYTAVIYEVNIVKVNN